MSETNISPLRTREKLGTPLATGDEPPHHGAMDERLVKLEAEMNTVRAEIRASGAETREAVLTAVEKLRADGATLRADTVTQIQGLKVWALGGLLAFLVTVILAAVNLFWKPNSQPQQTTPSLRIEFPTNTAAPSKPNQDGTTDQPGAVQVFPPQKPATAISHGKH